MPSGQVPLGTPGLDSASSLRLVDTGAGRASSLKAGALVFVTVRQNLGGDLYAVSVGPRLLSAVSSSSLQIGSVLKARVELSGGEFVLRLARGGQPERGASGAGEAGARSFSSSDKAASLLASAGLPNDAAGRTALIALLGAGLSPEGRALVRVRAAALRGAAEGREDEYASLAARMEEKGMSAEGEALEELLSLGDGRSGDRGHSGGGEGGSGRRGGSGDRGGASVHSYNAQIAGRILDSDFELEVPEEELSAVLGSLVHGIVSRAQTEADPAQGASILARFNSLRGKGGGWVLSPFRFSLGEVDFAGSFRIQLPYLRGGEGRFEAYFSASRASQGFPCPDEARELWSFFLSFGGSRASSLRLVAPGGGELLPARVDELASLLAASSCVLSMSERGEGARGSGRLDIGGFDADA